MIKKIGKSVFNVLVSVALLSSALSASAFANEFMGIQPVGTEAMETQEQAADYAAVKGRIVGISVDDKRSAMLEDEVGNRIELVVTGNTYIDEETVLINGSQVVGIYEKSSILAEGSSVIATAILADFEDRLVMVDHFDQNLVNENNTLKLLNTDQAQVITLDGEKYTGTLTNQDLIVFYSASTRSMPAQASPSKIIVLSPAPVVLEQFASFSGKVITVIEESTPLVMLENSAGVQTGFMITAETYVNDDVVLAEGSNITFYYNPSGIAPAIYPPRYYAEVVTAELGTQSFYFGVFNQDLINTNNSLKIIGTQASQIITTYGSPYTETINNKLLLVYYTKATFSIPAQITPYKIVVFDENTDSYENVTRAISAVDEMDIVVENNIISAPRAFINNDGVVMVPLREIAEALSYSVTWNEAEASIGLNTNEKMIIGSNLYTTAYGITVELKAPAVLVQGRTFVPLNFFTKVTMLNNAYVFEGSIVIDNGEKME